MVLILLTQNTQELHFFNIFSLYFFLNEMKDPLQQI